MCQRLIDIWPNCIMYSQNKNKTLLNVKGQSIKKYVKLIMCCALWRPSSLESIVEIHKYTWMRKKCCKNVSYFSLLSFRENWMTSFNLPAMLHGLSKLNLLSKIIWPILQCIGGPFLVLETVLVLPVSSKLLNILFQTMYAPSSPNFHPDFSSNRPICLVFTKSDKRNDWCNSTNFSTKDFQASKEKLHKNV